MAGASFLDTLTGAYSGLRRSVVDPATGNAVVTSAPTGEVRQRGSLLPIGRDDDGRLVPAVPQGIFDAIDAARYPGQVARGEVNIFDPSTGHASDEAIKKGLDLAGSAMTGSLPFSAPAGALRMFGGRNAATADRQALATAEVARDLGLSREATFRETGWHHGTDGKPRYEISDANARLTGSPFQPTGEKFAGLSQYEPKPLGEVLDHPELYKAYPDLQRLKFTQTDDYGPGAQYAAPGAPGQVEMIRMDTSHPSTLSTLLHEIQHAVQHREGFTQGGSPGHFSDPSLSRTFAPFEYGDSVTNLDLYRRIGGEVEARNVQQRMGMTPAERRASPPWATQDIADPDQIIRVGREKAAGGAPHAALSDALVASYINR